MPTWLTSLTWTQVEPILRQALPTLGGIMIWLGWVTPEGYSAWTQFVFQVGGPLFSFLGVLFVAINTTKAAMVKKVAALPETKVNPTTGTIQITDEKLVAASVAAGAPPTK